MIHSTRPPRLLPCSWISFVRKRLFVFELAWNTRSGPRAGLSRMSPAAVLNCVLIFVRRRLQIFLSVGLSDPSHSVVLTIPHVFRLRSEDLRFGIVCVSKW